MSRHVRAVAILAVVAATLAAAASAQAAFPGHNGLLVVQPYVGGGLILIDAHGHRREVICTDPLLCGQPASPHFSPDGRALAFADAQSRRPAIVATDGICLWCLLGPPLTTLTGTAPSFTANGRGLTLASSYGLWQAPLTGGAARWLTGGRVTSAAWSSTGMLAFARAGAVWVASPGRGPHWLARGGVPSFSPDGRRLALSAGGWIWIVPVGRGKPRRLVRGSAPAFSPDGRQIAFIGGANHVFRVNSGGGRPQVVPNVRGRALDWQPLPRVHQAVCAVPAGSKLVGQSAAAVVSADSDTPSAPYSGCLLATGVRRLLLKPAPTGLGAVNALVELKLSGRFAALYTTYTDRTGTCRNVVTRTDLGSPAAPVQLYSRICNPGLPGIDSLSLDSSGFAAWRAREQLAAAQPFIGLSCSTSALCVAVDAKGNAASSTAPRGGPSAWTLSKVAPALSGVVCESASLCLGLDGGSIATSTNPTGGAGAWTAPVGVSSAQLTSASCPSSSLCVAVDDLGDVVSSVHPTGGVSAWQSDNVAGTSYLTGVSCASATLCLAVGQSGEVLYSTNPTGGAGAWIAYTAAPGIPALLGITCLPSGFCLATDTAGDVLATKTPTLGIPWTVVHIPGEAGPLSQPACPSANLCLVRDASGNVLASTNPGSGAGSIWTRTNVSTSALTGLACPSTSLCLATDSGGNVFSTNAPAGGLPWTPTPIDVPPCGACIAEQLFVQDDRGRQAVDAAQAGPGNVLRDVALAGNSLTLAWTHAGVPAIPFALR